MRFGKGIKIKEKQNAVENVYIGRMKLAAFHKILRK